MTAMNPTPSSAKTSNSRPSVMKAGVILPLIGRSDSIRSVPTLLEEAVALAAAAGHTVVFKEIVRLRTARPATLFGEGQTNRIGEGLRDAGAELAIVSGSLSAVQQKTLERLWGRRVIDRTGLILETFARRAHTREGVLQVELARILYEKSRLVRRWTHLERQRGALGFVGGAGETQLEADRRALDAATFRIQRRLDRVRKTRRLHRMARKHRHQTVVAIVGYTNAGKSTLFNRLTTAHVEESSRLFATLDPTVRKLALGSGREVQLADTVGFISDLPTPIVAAFRATLEEVTDADIILHVRDISNPEWVAQSATVLETLQEIGIDTESDKCTPILQVWNKLDRLGARDQVAMRAAARREVSAFPVSARTGEGIDGLLEGIARHLPARDIRATLCLGFGEGRRRAWLHENTVVCRERHDDSGFQIDVIWSEAQSRRHHALFSADGFPGAETNLETESSGSVVRGSVPDECNTIR